MPMRGNGVESMGANHQKKQQVGHSPKRPKYGVKNWVNFFDLFAIGTLLSALKRN
jgi:hypothetical protein